MKKLTTIALAALMAVSFALPTAAANVERIGSNANSVKATFSALSKKPTVDGTIGKNEYAEVKYNKNDITFIGATDALADKAEKTGFKLYAGYDAENVYIGVVVDTPDYVSTAATKEKTNPIYQQHGLQFVLAKGNETKKEDHYGFAITRNSDTNDLIFHCYTNTFKYEWAPVGGKDFAIVTKDGVTTYEVVIPARLFGVEKLVKGETIRLCATNLLNTAWTSGVSVVEWGNGCFIAKNTQQSPVITLGDTMKTATAGAAAATADAASIAVAALAVSAAAAVVIAKKH